MFQFKTFSIFIYFLQLVIVSKGVIVKIDNGLLEGSTLIARHGRPYNAFRGIPYAQPPIGALRFQPPQPAQSWNGTRKATESGPICIQNIMYSDTSNIQIMGEEDCLSLDVYVPTNTFKSLPVIVFIHGGAFKSGSSSIFDPIYFMDYDVIIVEIQYRLHVLGFLSTGDEIIPGNMGLKDQVAALRWIKNNIVAFGGNSNSVTLLGSSSGAVAAHLHLYSPLGKGLFHRIICQSGTAFFPNAFSTAENVRKRTSAFAEMLHCPTQTSRKMVECLQSLPVELLIQTHEKMFLWTFQPTILFSITNEYQHEGAFITEIPNIPLVEVPMITGVNKREGIYVVAALIQNEGGKYFEMTTKAFPHLLPISLGYHMTFENGDEKSKITDLLKEYYLQDKNFGMETLDEIIDLYTDGLFTMRTLEAAKVHKGPVYLYLFDHLNQHTFTEFLNYRYNGSNYCVSHVDEMINLFHFPGTHIPKLIDGPDYYVSEKMLQYWVNFARKGNPNGENDLWKPTKTDNFEYLRITSFEDEMKQGLRKDGYEFWKKLDIIRPGTKSVMSKDEL